MFSLVKPCTIKAINHKAHRVTHKVHRDQTHYMKLRIKGNSVRIRLTRTEVARIATEGYLEEQTSFGTNALIYALKQVDTGNELSAAMEANKITLFIPSSLSQDWPSNNVVGFSAKMPIGNGETLYLLLEKDFVCLDHTDEDQSDNYENPNRVC